MHGLAEANASSNSSGSSEGNIGGYDNPSSSPSDDLKSCVEDEHADRKKVFQDGLLKELEVNTVVGVVLKSMNGVIDAESAPNPVIRLSLASTA
ncbi:hypothetical protein HRI_000032100 [Hibiscus trionum]|uniref:Uncharacterized protein n=1 Tax=Hibiscus trionum TaxID=183268 RepID=A0A9W7GQQ8_HIBTR|nr:hypothetical protein HRI_000032100 [Hibiscus trionum]